MPDTITIDKAELTQAELDIIFGQAKPDEEAIVRRDHRTCNCALTYVHRKRHGALGTAIEIRLCCMAQFIEQKFGLSPGTFFKVLEFDPSWVWDCEQVHVIERTKPDGSKESIRVKQGPPPRWLRERMVKKGIPILNQPD